MDVVPWLVGSRHYHGCVPLKCLVGFYRTCWVGQWRECLLEVVFVAFFFFLLLLLLLLLLLGLFGFLEMFGGGWKMMKAF